MQDRVFFRHFGEFSNDENEFASEGDEKSSAAQKAAEQ